MVRLDGAPNFRDLGGLPTVDGRRTRPGRLYRSDSLHRLTDEDLRLVRTLGISTLIDLQAPEEAARVGRGPLQAEPIGYHNVSVNRSLEQPPATTLAERYLAYLLSDSAGFAAALALMAEAQRYPVVFHCFFGKDRTGVLAALVLDLVGVERAAIAEDYVASGPGMALILERLRADPVYAETIERTPPFLLDTPAQAIGEFLELVDEEFGGTRPWALRSGLADDQLAALTDLFL